MGNIYNLNEDITSIEKHIRKTFNINVFREAELRVYAELIHELELKPSNLSFNFSKFGVLIPDVNDEYMLPVMQTTLENPKKGIIVGRIQIPQIFVSKVSNFPELYFKQEGYPTKKAGLEDLSEIHNYKLKSSDVLSMYWITNFEKHI